MDEKQYERLVDFVLEIKKDQEEIKEITIKNSVVLAEHMRRTEVAEKRIELIQEELEPVKDHVKAMGLIVKVGAGLIAAGGTIAGIYEVIRNFQSI